MPTLPALIAEDMRQIDAVLADFLFKSEASAVLLTAEGGFVVAHAGKTSSFDVAALGALAANACYAMQAIAKVIEEPNFNTLYQQGEKHSLLVGRVDSYHSMVVVFPAHLGVGAIKYYAADAIPMIAKQLNKARERAPNECVDPITLNLTAGAQIFKPKQPC